MSKQQLSSQTLLLLAASLRHSKWLPWWLMNPKTIFQSHDLRGDGADDDHPEHLHWHLQGRGLAQWRRSQVRGGVLSAQVSPPYIVCSPWPLVTCVRNDHPANALTVDSRVLSPGTSNLISMKKRRVDRWTLRFSQAQVQNQVQNTQSKVFHFIM